MSEPKHEHNFDSHQDDPDHHVLFCQQTYKVDRATIEAVTEDLSRAIHCLDFHRRMWTSPSERRG